MELSINDTNKKENNGHAYYQSEDFSSTGHDQSVRTVEEKDSLSDFQGIMLLIPTYICLGFIGLPYMVKLVGLWAGSIGLFVYGLVNEGCVLLLTDCAQNLTERVAVEAVVFMLYTLYLFELLSVMAAFAQDFLGQYVEVNKSVLIVVISILLIPVYLTKRMRVLAWMSTVANISTMAIFALTMPYLVTDLPDESTRPAIKFDNFLAVTTFSNDVIFSYGSIALVIPIRNRMRSTKTFDGWNGVLGLVLIFVTCFHVACGFYGYLKFGEATQSTYLLNLPQDNIFMTAMKVLFLFSVYCSTGVNVFIPVDTIWSYIGKRCNSEFAESYGEYIVRAILLIIVCLSTMLIPEFEMLMPLGGFELFFLMMILPGYIKICTMYGDADPDTWRDRVRKWMARTICYSLVISGIYLSVSGLIVSVYVTATNTEL